MKICTYLIIKVITENVLFPRHQAVVSRTEQGSFSKKYFHITKWRMMIHGFSPHLYVVSELIFCWPSLFSVWRKTTEDPSCLRVTRTSNPNCTCCGWIGGCEVATRLVLWSNLRVCCCGQAATLHTSRPRAGHNGEECQDPQSLSSLN